MLSDLCYGPFGSQYPTQWDIGIPIQSGYDPILAASSAVLTPVPYVTANEIAAELGSSKYLIEATDDTGSGQLGGVSQGGQGEDVFSDVVTNVTNAINSYLAAVYPIPFVRTGTPTIVQVSAVDINGAVTAITVLQPGFYLTAPASPNSPTYPTLPAWADPNHLQLDQYGTIPAVPPWLTNPQTGSGLSLAVTFVSTSHDGLTGFTASGVPTIAAGGSGYAVNDIVLFYGGQSFLPVKVRYAALILACEKCYRRRLAPDEVNPFAKLAEGVRGELSEISKGNAALDANFRRSFSPAAAWVTPNRINMNSL